MKTQRQRAGRVIGVLGRRQCRARRVEPGDLHTHVDLIREALDAGQPGRALEASCRLEAAGLALGLREVEQLGYGVARLIRVGMIARAHRVVAELPDVVGRYEVAPTV